MLDAFKQAARERGFDTEQLIYVAHE
nr:hypothetical protein [Venatoribacter cucullus]